MTISTHVLDTSIGRPAAAVDVRLLVREADGTWREIANATTGADGRVAALGSALDVGAYCLRFDVGSYFRAARGTDSFYSVVNVEFNAADPSAHYHVPLLVSPYGYSTYRGS
jgi:5-hydroxyisourate hydrolase